MCMTTTNESSIAMFLSTSVETTLGGEKGGGETGWVSICSCTCEFVMRDGRGVEDRLGGNASETWIRGDSIS